jgi:hypothetical protein
MEGGEPWKGNSLGPFFLYAVEKSCGAFAIVFLRVDGLIKGLKLLDIVLRRVLIVSEE